MTQPQSVLRTAEQLSVALIGRYVVEREIGAGGMATVYLARDSRHNRQVALKVLRPDLGAALGPERFFTEIQVTANLQHPNLLPLFDSGEVKDPTGSHSLLFYVMPYVEGQTLRERLTREGQLPVEEAVRISVGIAGALDYAHRHGVVHRDLKPENILMHEGQPVVMDFGIALAVSNAGGERLTQMGLSLGTPQYMSPEQATGDREVDARSDIYSLGAVTYEMLTGTAPHTGNSLQAVIAKVIVDKPASIRATREMVSEHIDLAIARSLAKLPADRFATAADFARALVGPQALVQRSAQVPAVLQPRAASALGRVMQHPVARPVVVGSTWLVLLGGAAAIGAVAAVALIKTAPAPVATLPVVVPDSVGLPGSGRALALSPDGSRLAIVASVSGQRPKLYSRRMTGVSFGALHGTDGASAPSFSPKGDQLLFVAGGKLMHVSSDGGATLPLADSTDGQHSWGDNDQIVFTRRGALFSVPAAGGTQRPIAKPDSAHGVRAYGWPDVLPGSKDALITITRSGGSAPDSNRIGVVSLADGHVTDLGLAGTGPRYAAPGYIVFATAGGSLWAAPFNPGKHTVTGAKQQLADGVQVDSTGAADVAVSAKGTLVYGERSGKSSNRARVALAIIDAHGAIRQKSPQSGDFYSPRVSPDGSRIAITQREAGTRTDVWIYEIATNNLPPMTREGIYAFPEWVDAKRIAFREGAGSPGRFLIEPWDLSTGAELFYSPPPMNNGGSPAYNLALGPGGKPMAIMRSRTGAAGGNRQDIGVIAATGGEGPLVNTKASELSPRVSPNGKWIAYASNESGTFQIYVLPLPGPGARVPVSVEHGIEPMWSRDGKTLFYVSHDLLLGAHIDETGGRFLPTKADTLFSFAEKGFVVRGPPGRGPTLGFYDVFANGDFVVLAGGSTIDDTRSSIIAMLQWPQLMTSQAPGAGKP